MFCGSDPLAFGVLDACQFELGLQSPRDILVVGFDDVAEAAHQRYDLTTLGQGSGDLAVAAVGTQLHSLDTPDGAAQRLLLPDALMRRGSARLSRDYDAAAAARQ